jgi:hypothetical protein
MSGPVKKLAVRPRPRARLARRAAARAARADPSTRAPLARPR